MVPGALLVPAAFRCQRIFPIRKSCGQDCVNNLEEHVSECHDGSLVPTACSERVVARLEP